MKWTDSQWDAIEARRGTVLVAAAAGSGKTAVLVQRAIERLIDRDDPTPANRLLIVTFTKAAAAENTTGNSRMPPKKRLLRIREHPRASRTCPSAVDISTHIHWTAMNRAPAV